MNAVTTFSSYFSSEMLILNGITHREVVQTSSSRDLAGRPVQDTCGFKLSKGSFNNTRQA